MTGGGDWNGHAAAAIQSLLLRSEFPLSAFSQSSSGFFSLDFNAEVEALSRLDAAWKFNCANQQFSWPQSHTAADYFAHHTCQSSTETAVAPGPAVPRPYRMQADRDKARGSILH